MGHPRSSGPGKVKGCSPPEGKEHRPPGYSPFLTIRYSNARDKFCLFQENSVLCIFWFLAKIIFRIYEKNGISLCYFWKTDHIYIFKWTQERDVRPRLNFGFSWGYGSVVKDLPGMVQALGSISSTTKNESKQLWVGGGGAGSERTSSVHSVSPMQSHHLGKHTGDTLYLPHALS